MEHKGIGGHAPADARVPIRCFKRLHGRTVSRVRLTFVRHAAEGGLGFGRFQKILKRFRKVSVPSCSAIEVSECFRKFQSGIRQPRPNGSKNPVVEHKEMPGMMLAFRGHPQCPEHITPPGKNAGPPGMCRAQFHEAPRHPICCRKGLESAPLR